MSSKEPGEASLRSMKSDSRGPTMYRQRKLPLKLATFSNPSPTKTSESELCLRRVYLEWVKLSVHRNLP